MVRNLAKVRGTFVLILLVAGISGCNFFGKESEESTLPPLGALPDGSSVIGTWSALSWGDFPSVDAYTFDPTGNAQVRFRDPRASGTDCLAYGTFKVLSSTVVIDVQAYSSSECRFPDQIRLESVRVSDPGHYIEAREVGFTSGGGSRKFLLERNPIFALVGLWDFRGQAGIDYLWFDEHGYCLMQLTAQEGETQPLVLVGYYDPLVTGGVRLIFFSDSSFDVLSGAFLEFSDYLTNGSQLQLDYRFGDETESYLKERL
jgi:hypothetical protein